MKSWLKVGFVLSLAFLVPLLVLGGGDAAKGKTVFTSKCATCHGPMGEGKDAIAKMFKVEMRHLGSKEVQARPDAELRKIITEGNGKMKPVKLSDAESADVLAYVRCLALKK